MDPKQLQKPRSGEQDFPMVTINALIAMAQRTTLTNAHQEVTVEGVEEAIEDTEMVVEVEPPTQTRT